jgi:membrane dipeptidase
VTTGPRVDIHAHPGRSFLAGLGAGDALARILGGDDSDAAVTSIKRTPLALVAFATVADLRVLGFEPGGGLYAARPFHPGEAYADHLRQLGAIAAVLDRHNLSIARRAADALDAHADGRTAVLLTCEGADFVEGYLDRVAEAHAAGVRSITLVHYRTNELGDIQTAPPVHGGLTEAGIAVVAEMNRLRMVIDLAHATFETTVGVLEVSTQPVMISHSHLRGPGSDHPRLLTAEHATAVASAGGLIGAWPAGVACERLEDFVDEILRLVDLVGVDHVAIGTDMDANYRPVLTAYDQLDLLAEHLLERGAAPDEVDRILGGNAIDLIEAVCG